MGRRELHTVGVESKTVKSKHEANLRPASLLVSVAVETCLCYLSLRFTVCLCAWFLCIVYVIQPEDLVFVWKGVVSFHS